MTMIDHIAHAKHEFRLFRLPNSRVQRITREIEIMRKVGKLSREAWEKKGMRGKRIPQKYLAIIGPSGSGKSTCVQTYVETMMENEILDDEVRPVVHVTLSSQSNTKSLGQDILEEYEDPEFEKGIARSLLKRASNAMELARTDVLVLDEFHHLINKDPGGGTAWSVTETIKRMLIRGACPLIFIGTEDAAPLLTHNNQFSERVYAPIFIKPLSWNLAIERNEFRDHCIGFDTKLVEHGIFSRKSGLLTGDIPACMYDVSEGVIGTASNVFEVATVFAIEREADCIEREDLDKAVEEWAIPLNKTTHNAFRHGVRTIQERGKAT
ncbi:ATP-binding protein [Methylobacterium sp. BTF04]|uniref:ATP-binding protein n=1 Tax=Methylobacterium sp. BTF04 TaxID=2708300 RepID=UPI0013D83E51|nr:ATP-binding protein [Methylobacterium sp. BTF04]NEU14153.1 ATP-binding protein [Methylobacterium sp. BTF04]